MRKKSGLYIMARLFALIGNLSFALLLAILNGSIGHIIATFIPILGAIGVCKMLGASISISYQTIFILLIVFGILRGVLKYIEQYFNHFIAFKLLAVLRDKIYCKLCLLCPAKLESKQKGSILSMVTADIETIEVFYAHTLSPFGIALACSLSVSLFIGFTTSVYLGLFAGACYFIIGIILPLISSKFISRKGTKYRENFTKFNGDFMDAIKGSKDIVLHKRQKKFTSMIADNSKTLIDDSKKYKSKSYLFEAITGLIIILLNAGMLAFGYYLHTVGAVDLTMLVIAVVGLMSSYGPVLALNSLPSNLSQTFASGERLLDLLDEEPVVTDIFDKNDIDFSNLEVNNLAFSYLDGATVLSDINLNVKVGEIVGIMGKSGCGKSTMLKLLLRFWDKTSGEIKFNDKDILSINTTSLKQNVTMVSQSTYIFSDTAKNNLLLSNPNASMDDIISACKKASIHDVIQALPQGYETPLGANGVTLSAGETQRLGLARAFLSPAKLILLDEPTSNVDAINEGIILSALSNNSSDKAIIMVSHRNSTMSIADRVYNFKDGKIAS